MGFRLARAVQLFVLVGVGYALGAEVSWRWFGASNIGLAFFPAAGVTVAALILTRRPWWPVILLAAGTAEFVVDVAHGLSPGIALGYAAANIVEPLTAAALLSVTARGAVPSVDLTVRADAIRFSAFALVAGPLAGGLIGATVKSLDQGTSWFSDYAHWWAGDGLAVLAVGTPLVLFISRPEKLRLLRQFDGALVLALTLVAAFVSFGEWRVPPALVVIPVMIFAALRLGVYGVSASGLILASIANYATAHGDGPFSEFDLPHSQELAVTQLLLAVTILTGWFLAMAIEERTRAESAQRLAERDRAETAVMYERARRREALAEQLTAAHDFNQFLTVISTSAPQIGATGVDAHAPDPAEATTIAFSKSPDGTMSRAVVPLRGATGSVEAVVELTWDPPESEANARDAIATLVAVSGPTLVRVGLDALMDARRQRSELRFEFGAALATAVTARQTARVIAEFATRYFDAAGATVARLNAHEDSLDVLAEAGLGMRTSADQGPDRLEGFGPATEAIRDQTLVIVPDRATIAERYPLRTDLLDATELAAVAAVPFVAGDETIGAVRLHFRAGQLSPDQIEQQYRGFADQAAQALERARLADSQRDALRQANRLRDAVGILATGVTEDDVTAAVVEHGFPALGCTAGALMLCDETNPEVVQVSRVVGFDEQIVRRFTADGTSVRTPGQDALLTGTPVFIRDEHELAAQYPDSIDVYKRHNIVASANLPLLDGRRQFGSLSLSYHRRQTFSDAHRYVLETYAQFVADALLRSRATMLEHEIVRTLQQTLLPAIPELLAAQVATRYRPASIGLPVGGDWYDIIALSPTTTAFVVGDVLGKGPAAAAGMGQLRTAVRTAATGSTPAEVMSALDRLSEEYDEHFMATIGYFVFDAVARTITYCSAGHCPAAVVADDGAVTWLPSNGPPVGANLVGTRTTCAVDVDHRARVVLFTDGLIERRDESLEVGLDRLAEVLACHRADDVDATAESLLGDLASAAMQRDDIALLVADLHTVPDEFSEQVSARLDELRPLRARIRTWLDESFIEPSVADDLAIAINEAVANAIEHGSSDESAVVGVVARRDDDSVEVEVTDPGTPRVGVADPDRGRGFTIMHALMDDVTFTPSLVGTTVRMRRALQRR